MIAVMCRMRGGIAALGSMLSASLKHCYEVSKIF